MTLQLCTSLVFDGIRFGLTGLCGLCSSRLVFQKLFVCSELDLLQLFRDICVDIHCAGDVGMSKNPAFRRKAQPSRKAGCSKGYGGRFPGKRMSGHRSVQNGGSVYTNALLATATFLELKTVKMRILFCTMDSRTASSNHVYCEISISQNATLIHAQLLKRLASECISDLRPGRAYNSLVKPFEYHSQITQLQARCSEFC